MKLLLVLVTAIAVSNVDALDISKPPEGHGTVNKVKLFPEEIVSQFNSQDIQDGSQDLYSSNVEHQLKKTDLIMADNEMSYLEDDMDQQQRKPRRSRCKARNACVVMGGFCVTNATLCSGRLVPEGCKGNNCQCCVPGTLEDKFDNLEEELHSFQENMNKSNSDIYSELKSLKVNMNISNLNLDSKLESLAESKGCPEGFFVAPSSHQCFKYFTDVSRTWYAARSKCQTEGLALAKPYAPVSLRSYLSLRYGDGEAWVDARGTGSTVKWVRDGQTIGSSNPMWYNGQPGTRTTSSWCLLILAHESSWKAYPNQPYHMQSCSSSAKDYALCELVE